jgi:5'-phosphate synthase pdxT subunit
VTKIVGVLAIQGDFQAHLDVLQEIGIDAREIRNSPDLRGVSHLVVPGGESTTIRKVAQSNGLWDKIMEFKGPVMGTCMGSILMADNIQSPDSKGWGMLNLTIKRNAYGRQINSFRAMGRIAFVEEPFEMVFIRAPKIIAFGNNVEPIAWLGDEVTGVVSGNKLALTFHPELSDSPVMHKFFLGL